MFENRVQWNHYLRTYCNKNFRGWIAGFNPFRQLVEIRTPGYPGLVATGSYFVNPKCHSRSSSMVPVWLKVFVYLYIFVHIWMYIDHLWSQSWVSPLCSGTLLQLPYTCICFFSLFGCLCGKNGAKKNPPRIPVTFCDFHFSSETPSALTVVTGPTSRYGLLFFFHSVPRKKKYKNSEPGNMCLSQHGAVSCRFAIHTQLLKKKSTLSHFLKLTLRAQLFSRGKIKIKKTNAAHFFKKPWASTRVLRKHDGPERARW